MSATERRRSFDALVLARRPFGESEALTLLTRDEGLVEVTARGVTRQSSGLAAACEIGVLSEFTVFDYRQRLRVDHASIRYAFPRLREDIVRLSAASCLAELATQLLIDCDRETSAEAWALMAHALYALEAAEGDAIFLALHAAELRLLVLGGFAPQFGRCAACGREEEEGAGHWRFAEHAWYCRRHPLPPEAPAYRGAREADALPISAALHRALVWFTTAPIAQLFQVRTGEDLRAELDHFVTRLIAWTLERQPDAYRLLEQLASFKGLEPRPTDGETAAPDDADASAVPPDDD